MFWKSVLPLFPSVRVFIMEFTDWLIFEDEGCTFLKTVGNHQTLMTICFTAVLCDLKCHKIGSIVAWTLYQILLE
jgi:hypothetical protein